jgi:hypothetical protein
MRRVVNSRTASARSAADLVGQDGLDAHRLRRADQVALRAEVDRICMMSVRAHEGYAGDPDADDSARGVSVVRAELAHGSESTCRPRRTCGILLAVQPIRASLCPSREVWQGRVDEAQQVGSASDRRARPFLSGREGGGDVAEHGVRLR